MSSKLLMNSVFVVDCFGLQRTQSQQLKMAILVILLYFMKVVFI